MATNKFLGIDSINVLKKYIDNQIIFKRISAYPNIISYITDNDEPYKMVSNFTNENYFICNSTNGIHYALNGNSFKTVANGYIGTFVNIGTGDILIEALDSTIVGSGINTNTIVVKPNETIELINYINEDNIEFIIVGKSKIDIQEIEPTPEPTPEIEVGDQPE